MAEIKPSVSGFSSPKTTSVLSRTVVSAPSLSSHLPSPLFQGNLKRKITPKTVDVAKSSKGIHWKVPALLKAMVIPVALLTAQFSSRPTQPVENPPEHRHTEDSHLDHLLEGVSFFQQQVFPVQRAEFEKLAQEQHPAILFISCIDSRIDPLLITHSKPGEMFIVRNVGNVLPLDTQEKVTVEEAELDFAVNKYHVKHIVICGHSDCGAMKAFMDPENVRSAKDLSEWLKQHKQNEQKPLKCNLNTDGSNAVDALAQENVVRQMEVLATIPSIQEQLKSGQLQIHGWFYNIKNGSITAFDTKKERFIPLEQRYAK